MSTGVPQPDKRFFELDPRAAEIRNVVLEAISATRAYLSSDGEDEASFSLLLLANGKLTELGVEPGMHVIEAGDPDGEAKQREIMTKPVMAAEFVAGQLRSLLIRSNAFAQTAGSFRARLEEHDLLLGEVEGAHLVEGQAVTDVAVQLGMVGMLSVMADYDAGPSAA